MERVPVILSPPEDPSAALVYGGLKRWGIEPIWVSSLCGGSAGPISIQEDAQGTRLGFGADGLPAIGAVWYRRPREPRPGAGILASDLPFVQGEWSQFQKNVFALAGEVTHALWVNDPRAASETENKVVQLQAARKAGLRVPETLLSNDPRTIRAFIARHGKVIAKTFRPHTWRNSETGQLYNVTAAVLDSASSFEDAAVAMCPGIFQRYVEKVCDLRVTVIGDRIFPLRLRSTRGGAFVDWRPYVYFPEMAADACELPEACQLKLKDLMRRLGIIFGCIDLVVDAAGDIHFLEVNQGGQFLFVEDLVESMPVLKAMCSLLIQGRVDYSLDSSLEVSLKRCRESDDFQAWVSQHGDSMKVENWLYTNE